MLDNMKSINISPAKFDSSDLKLLTVLPVYGWFLHLFGQFL